MMSPRRDMGPGSGPEVSHLSVELARLGTEDLATGPERMEASFAAVAPWVRTACEAVDKAAAKQGIQARVSTCLVVDDYIDTPGSPADVLPPLQEAAARAGHPIDYLIRISAAAHRTGPAGTLVPVELLLAALVAEPIPGQNGSRPPPQESGWLSNGQRSPLDRAAMDVAPTWSPPRETSARHHSIFLDAQLWAGAQDNPIWSRALLAATWQLLRLGVLRVLGQAVLEPLDVPDTLPERWSQLPAVSRLRLSAPPFPAYRTLSVLPPRSVPVEHAVRMILGQVWHDPQVARSLADQARSEGFPLPDDTVDRIAYVLATGT